MICNGVYQYSGIVVQKLCKGVFGPFFVAVTGARRVRGAASELHTM